MPVIGTRCPQGYEFEGKTIHTFDECLNKCTNKCLPLPILLKLFDEIRTDEHRGTYITATALNGCLRQTYLERTTHYFIRPLDRQYATLRGSLVHGSLEYIKKFHPEFIVEEKVTKNFEFDDGCQFSLSGRFDLFDTRTGTLYDYKTIKDNGIDYILRDGMPKQDHIVQTNVYKHLIENGEFENDALKGRKFEVKNIIIIYICMKTIIYSGQEYKVKDRNGDIISYKIDPVPIMEEKEIVKHIRQKLPILAKSFSEIEMPPIPDKQTQQWLCGLRYKDMDGYCQVRYNCEFWREEAKKRGINVDQEKEMSEAMIKKIGEEDVFTNKKVDGLST